jgi:hypothetical protein
LRASPASDAIDTGVTLPENPFEDSVSVVCIDEPIVWSFSGITTHQVSECRGGVSEPFTGPLTPPAVTHAMATAALNLQSDCGDRSGLVVFRRLEGFVALRTIGMGAFAAWVLSLVAWQVFDTQPQSPRRGGIGQRYATPRQLPVAKRPAQPEAAYGYVRPLPDAVLRSTPAAILRSTAAINRA